MAQSDHYIFAHGLNVRPTVMQLLAEELGCAKDQYTLISLPGHSGEEELSRAVADRWLDSFRDQYNKVCQVHTNIIFVGYSLGGLLMTYLLGDGQIVAPRKQILLAPALAFQQWTKIPTIIPKATFDQVTIPSFTPENYKANPGVSLGAYKVLFTISQELDGMAPDRYNIPTLVFCDRWDELVQAEGLRKFIAAKQLTEWDLVIVPSSFWQRVGKKHLLVAQEYYADSHWKQIRQQIEAFVNG
ncbi:alpha/beta hydrolase [Tunicatimonas pelagia]|uniref:alpha/beta hydrolase n=1 Tax=Tunicatimonas pelagia TaxID=931531 RepID=UPI002666F932|nr:alpha/beta fold hydrolase [Tunicatimonas pelagia]WKN42000.1 alpha/beta fold hydrolase [Tunicatimonas pelagia]